MMNLRNNVIALFLVGQFISKQQTAQYAQAPKCLFSFFGLCMYFGFCKPHVCVVKADGHPSDVSSSIPHNSTDFFLGRPHDLNSHRNNHFLKKQSFLAMQFVLRPISLLTFGGAVAKLLTLATDTSWKPLEALETMLAV